MKELEDLFMDYMYEVSTNTPFMFRLKKYEPQLVSELKPVGVVDDEGKFIDVRFQNFIGDDVDVMAQSETIPNACIYQGAKDGFRPAVDAFLSDGLHDDVCGVSVPVLTKEFMANLPVGYFKVGMQLRLVNKQEDTYEYTPVNLREANSERASILLPGNVSSLRTGMTRFASFWRKSPSDVIPLSLLGLYE